MAKLTPEQAARALLAMHGTGIQPDLVARNYRNAAETLRGYAAKAADARSGKYRGYTEARALEEAADNDWRAEHVTAELRKLMAN